jgi:GGDEF domain-containing protein
MLTAKGLSVDKVVGLTAGVDDYLVKPFDTAELIARVSSTLRPNKEFREVSPLTGLPGNARVRREIVTGCGPAATTRSGTSTSTGSRASTTCTGFDRGDEFITALASSLHRAVAAVSPPSVFLGHIGGDDFVFICTPEQVLPLTKRAVTDFEAAADQLYDTEDARRGYIEVPDRRGNKHRAHLVTLSIGVAESKASGRRFTDPRVVVAVASEMKKVAKSQARLVRRHRPPPHQRPRQGELAYRRQVLCHTLW